MTLAPQRLRIGAVSYLNAKPLVYGLAEAIEPYADLSCAVPSKLADDLAAGSLDVGLIPVIELLRNPSYTIASDACIACDGPVWSVRVLFRTPPAQVKTFATDEGSRTSVVLAKILMYEKFGVRPNPVPFPLTQTIENCHADAMLVIGDRAMDLNQYKDHFVEQWDLGEVWLEHTGLPFVFAAWVASPAAQRHERYKDLCQAFQQQRDHGLANVESIALQCAAPYQLSESQIIAYLTRFLNFKSGSREKEALALYHSKAQELGLLDNPTGKALPTTVSN